MSEFCLKLSPPKDLLSGPESFEAPQIGTGPKKTRDFQSFFNGKKAKSSIVHAM